MNIHCQFYQNCLSHSCDIIATISTLSPVSTGMDDRVLVRLPETALYFGMQPTTKVDSAFYSPWDGKMMSTSQRAVILCGWGVKAGMV